MYLNSVLHEIRIESQPPKSLDAEHLYKLNEAIFNLPEDDVIDTNIANRLFQMLLKIRASYFQGNINDPEKNFFYDYIALLGTMYNQHFFAARQTEKILIWLTEALAGDRVGLRGNDVGSKHAQSYKSLRDENTMLKEEYEQLLKVQHAIRIIQNFEPQNVPEVKAKMDSKRKPKKSSSAQCRVSDEVGPEEATNEGVTTEGWKKRSKKKTKATPISASSAVVDAKKWKAKDS